MCVMMYHVRVQKAIASPGRGILAMDESNATCGLRLASIGLENTEVNRQAYRQLLVGTPGLGEYVSGAILFEETLYQSTTDGNKMVDVLTQAGIVPGIKVDKVWSYYTDTHNSSSSFETLHYYYPSSGLCVGVWVCVCVHCLS